MEKYFSYKTPKSPKGDFKVPFRGFRGNPNITNLYPATYICNRTTGYLNVLIEIIK
jgi:hypothetical protein